MNSKQKRLKLFLLFSNNLTSLLQATNRRLEVKNKFGEKIQISEPAVICPLCFTPYTKKDFDDDKLTIEHVPPKSVGGKEKVILCKSCNTGFGKEIDHHISRDLKVEAFVKKPGSKLSGRFFSNNSIPFRTDILIKNGVIFIDPSVDRATHKQLSQIFDYSKNQNVDSKFNLRFWGGNEKKARAAILKAAYLEMFSSFGHLFLLNSNANKISEQIRKPFDDILPHSSILEYKEENNFIGIGLIKEPVEQKTFLVNLIISDPESNYQKKVGVLIPGPDEKGWDSYCNFDTNKVIQYKLSFYSKLDCLKDSEKVLGFYEIWNEL